MVDVAGLLGLLFILFVHTVIAALLTRFFRVRLKTRWGSAIYTGAVTPVVLLVTTLLFGGFLQLGFPIGGRSTVIGVTIVLPMTLGIAFDYFWMPAPEEVEMPEEYHGAD
jgi:protein-S-isoprenylcysteine O-methyltransferase Ste14